MDLLHGARPQTIGTSVETHATPTEPPVDLPDFAPALEALSRVLLPGTEISIRYVVPTPRAPAATSDDRGPAAGPALPPPPAARKPLKLKEAAARFGVSKRSLDRAHKEGRLRCQVKADGRDAGALVVTLEEMERYLATLEGPDGRRAA